MAVYHLAHCGLGRSHFLEYIDHGHMAADAGANIFMEKATVSRQEPAGHMALSLREMCMDIMPHHELRCQTEL